MSYAKRRDATASLLFELDGGHRLDTDALSQAIEALDSTRNAR